MPFSAGVHPRLLFNASELAEIRQKSKSGLRAQLIAGLRERVSHYMDPSHADYMDFREKKKECWRLRSGAWPVLTALDDLAMAYAFCQDKRAGEYARDMLMEIIEKNIADTPSKAWGVDVKGWRHGPGHDKGKFAMSIALTYDLCYDLFSDAQRKRFAEYARECIDLAMQFWTIDWWQVANNRGLRGILSMTWLCLALEGDADLQDSQKHIMDGLWASEHYLFLAHDEFGAPFEGPGYAGCLGFVTLSALALKRSGRDDLMTNNRFERFPQYLTYEMLPGGGAAVPWNDCEFVNGSLSASLFLMDQQQGALIPWLARQYDLHPTRKSVEEFTSISMMLFMLHWQDDAPQVTPKQLDLPQSRHFAGRGIVSMRTGWEPQDMLVSHFCGRQQYKCHRQGDFNHISMYALGETFLVDAGYGWPRTDTTAAMDRWFGDTPAHNNVMIDGMWQRGVPREWPEGQMLDYSEQGGYVSSLGDASSTFTPMHRVRRSLRRVLLVRGTPHPFVAVLDVNEKDGADFTAEAHWHTHKDNCIELDGSKFIIRGKNNDCHGIVLHPTDAAISLAVDHLRPELRVISKAKVVETVTIFCPCRRGETPPQFSVQREAEGIFLLTYLEPATETRVRLTAATQGALRAPMQVSVQR